MSINFAYLVNKTMILDKNSIKEILNMHHISMNLKKSEAYCIFDFGLQNMFV